MEINTHSETIYKEAATEPGSTRSGLLPIADITLGLLRLSAGLMLIQHGVQKHFGLLLQPGMPWNRPAPLSQTWIAGTLEIVGGFLLALGLFTRVVAFILSGFMAFAYFLVHAKRGFWPILNLGELAALYCFVFLMFAGVGGGRFSVDGLRNRRHIRGQSAGEAVEPKKRRSNWRRRRLPETRIR